MMKKIIPYIFITLILVNLFAPFSLEMGRGGVQVQKNIARAENFDGTVEGYRNAFPKSSIKWQNSMYGDTGTIDTFVLKIDTGLPAQTDASQRWLHARAVGVSIFGSGGGNGFSFFSPDTGSNIFDPRAFIVVVEDPVSKKLGWADDGNILSGTDTSGVSYNYEEARGQKKMPVSISKSISVEKLKSMRPDGISGPGGLTKLLPGTTYNISLYYLASTHSSQGPGNGDLLGDDGNRDYYKIATSSFTTATKDHPFIGSNTVEENGGQATIVAGSYDMPACGVSFIGGSGTLGGCIAVILHYLLFVPTSYLFEMAGKFFDYTFFYSVSDASYRSPFVLEGWGVVRDFVNIFFIFVLLYIAFATILSLHGFKTKEMVINVIIIGLLINFSLFATQIIIDTSNIIARVFYTTQIIITGTNKDENKKVISKLGPDGEIQLSAAIVSKINPQTILINARKVNDINAAGGGDIDVITTILVILLCVAVNVTGIIVFLSVGLIFVARVIGLWLAMIFVPFAFFSYTVPVMEDIEFLGWKKWWPNTLKLAFLAPIFIFFMYLILKFLNVPDIISGSEGKSGVAFIIAVVVPFAFIIVLMNKAKSLAVKFAGDIGSAVTKAAMVGGGLAVAGGGLAAGTAAALGRGLITNPLKMMQSSQATRNAALKNFSALKPSTWGKAMSARMANATIQKPKYDAAGNQTNKGSNLLRDRLLAVKTRKADKSHATHALDEQADKIQKGAKFSDLAEPEQKKARDNAEKEEVSKGIFGKDSNTLDNSQIKVLSNILKNRKADGSLDRTNLTAYATALGKDPTKIHDGAHLENTYNKPDKDIIGNALTSAANGSYDVRNMKGGGLTALGIAAALTGVAPIIGAALAAHTSGALKFGLKKTFKTDLGVGQKDFFKDLSSTLSDALNNLKIDVKVDKDDHGKAKASSGGGGHH